MVRGVGKADRAVDEELAGLAGMPSVAVVGAQDADMSLETDCVRVDQGGGGA
jgi:hypothetical protein